MRAAKPSSLLVLTLLILALGYGTLRWWQGPQVEGYVINAMPLVQTVVATGRVVTESRAQISSEITAVVLERRVEEGDAVLPGDILLVLRADDIVAQRRQAETALTALSSSTRPQAEVALERAQTQLAQAERKTARRRDLAARSLLSTEALEQAVQAESVARSALEAARLTALALAPGNVEEQQLRERLAALQAQLTRPRCARRWPVPC